MWAFGAPSADNQMPTDSKSLSVATCSKPGGIVQAENDFKSLAGREEIRGPVRIKELPDGRTAVLRTDPSVWSKDGRPTLEIQPAGGGSAEIKRVARL